AGVAVNAQCLRCRTGAFALQYAIPVDDPHNAVDADADELISQIDLELRSLQADSGHISVDDALARVDTVASSFQRLATMLVGRDLDEQATDDLGNPVGGAPAPAATDTPTTTPQPTLRAVPGTSTPTVSVEPGTPTPAATIE